MFHFSLLSPSPWRRLSKEHHCIKSFDQISQRSSYANKSLFSFSLSKQACKFLTQHTARTHLVLTVPCPLTRCGNLVQSFHLQRWKQTLRPASISCFGAGWGRGGAELCGASVTQEGDWPPSSPAASRAVQFPRGSHWHGPFPAGLWLFSGGLWAPILLPNGPHSSLSHCSTSWKEFEFC